MKTKVLLSILAIQVLLVAQPLRGGVDAPNIDVTGVRLVADRSCPLASHLLVDVCSGAPRLYAAFPGTRSVERFENSVVAVRGTVEFTTCTLPLMRVAKIDAAPPPPCPPQLCRPGDPPPCPQEPAAAAVVRSRQSWTRLRPIICGGGAMPASLRTVGATS